MKNISSKQAHNMQKTTADTFLKPLETLQQVDAPEFLFTTIQAAILHSAVVSRPKVILAGAAFCLVILLNIALIMRSGNQADQPQDALVTGLSVHNDIYR